jgi:hypothetical protein
VKILLIAYDLQPPWDNGLKVYGKGLMASLQKIEGAQVDAVSSLSDVPNNNGHRNLKDSYDFVHVVITGLNTIRKSIHAFRGATIFKHIVTHICGPSECSCNQYVLRVSV